jgi:hypothetical protein
MGEAMTNRYTVKRLGAKPSPYMPHALRCQFAVETVRSITALADIQIVELECMWLNSIFPEAD